MKTSQPQSSNLPGFHSGMNYHTHRKCSKCSRFQRCEFAKLNACSRCQVTFYCSKECQKADYKDHKIKCIACKTERENLAKSTGIPSAWKDLMDWIEYFDPVLKNCAVAAYAPSAQPPESLNHIEDHALFCVYLKHNMDTKIPIQNRFELVGASVTPFEDLPFLKPHDMSVYAAMGRAECGHEYYGTARIMILSTYGDTDATQLHVKAFTLDQAASRVKVTYDGNTFDLLYDYIVGGVKMICHCEAEDNLGKALGICCCGDFTRHPKTAETFRKLEASGDTHALEPYYGLQ